MGDGGAVATSNDTPHSMSLPRLTVLACSTLALTLLLPTPPRPSRRPVENKKKSQKGVYVCPLYLYPMRTGTRERPSFMINVDLKAGAADPDHWVMRGTALLLALAS